MAKISYTIDHNLDLDATGKIKKYTQLDSIKDGVDFYLTVNKGEVPFSIFGNEITMFLYNVNRQDDVNELVDTLINDLSSKFNLSIKDYEVVVYEYQLKIKLFMDYNIELETTVNL